MPNIKEPRVAQLLVEQAAAKEREQRAAAGLGSLTMAAPVEHVVGDTVTVGGVKFTKHAELPTVEQVTEQVAVRGVDGLTRWMSAPVAACDNCAPLVASASVTRVDGSYGDENCQTCGGMVPAPVADAEPDLTKLLIAEIWKAANRERLSELWRLAQERNVPWIGPVETAGACRLRQIDCPQRELHTGGGKCACGWDSRFPG